MMVAAPIAALTIMTFMAAAPASAAGVVRSQSAHSAVTEPLPPKFSLINYLTIGKPDLRCLGISRGYAGIWDCTYVDDQNWHVGKQWGDSGYYQLVNGYDKCLSVPKGSHTWGIQLIAESCNKELTYQYWGYINADPGALVWWLNYDTKLSFGTKAGGSGNGTAVVQWPWQEIVDSDQTWSYHEN
jgi:hypothetical protein